ncbi:hypothetical protein D3C84_984730 [compost metagenome]
MIRTHVPPVGITDRCVRLGDLSRWVVQARQLSDGDHVRQGLRAQSKTERNCTDPTHAVRLSHQRNFTSTIHQTQWRRDDVARLKADTVPFVQHGDEVVCGADVVALDVGTDQDQEISQIQTLIANGRGTIVRTQWVECGNQHRGVSA